MINVIKRNGFKQEFDVQKLSKTLLYAGVNYEAVPDVVRGLEAWMPTIAINNEISSADIRNKIIEILGIRFPNASERYKNFSKLPLNN